MMAEKQMQTNCFFFCFFFWGGEARTGFLQLRLDQIPGVFKEFSRSHLLFFFSGVPFWTKLVYVVLGYGDTKIFSFLIIANSACLKHWIKCTGFLKARQIQVEEYSMSFPGLSIFFKDRLKRCKYQKLNYTWLYEGINTCNMATNFAHQTKWRIG